MGQLQFEVVQERMRSEYGVETTLEPLPWTVARWVLAGWPAVEKARATTAAVRWHRHPLSPPFSCGSPYAPVELRWQAAAPGRARISRCGSPGAGSVIWDT